MLSMGDTYEVARLVVEHTASLCVARTLGSTCKSAYDARKHLIAKSEIIVASCKPLKLYGEQDYTFDLPSFCACTRHVAIRKGASGLRDELSGPPLRLHDPFGPRYNLMQHAFSASSHGSDSVSVPVCAVAHLLRLVGQDEVARMLAQSHALRAATDPRVVNDIIRMLKPHLLPQLTEDICAFLDDVQLGDFSGHWQKQKMHAMESILNCVPPAAARGLALGLAERNGDVFTSGVAYKEVMCLSQRLCGIVGPGMFLKSNGVHLLTRMKAHAPDSPNAVVYVFNKVVKKLYMPHAGGWDMLLEHVRDSGAFVCEEVVTVLLDNACDCPAKVSNVVDMLLLNFEESHCEWQADLLCDAYRGLAKRGSKAAMATASLLGMVISTLRHCPLAIDGICQILNDRLMSMAGTPTIAPAASYALGHEALLNLLRKKWFAIAKLCYAVQDGDGTDRVMVKAGMDMVYAMP